MDDQPRYKPFRPMADSPFRDPAQLPVEGTIARGRLPQAVPETIPLPITAELLARGQERYQIYCLPCHSPLGDGDGFVTRRGFPNPPSYHSPRLRAASDKHFYQVMTEGYGIMYSYADRVAPTDRWAIVAYIRALQLSQHTPAAALPADVTLPEAP